MLPTHLITQSATLPTQKPPPLTSRPPRSCRWQCRLLKDERLRLLSFMDPAKLSLRSRWRELHHTLQRVGHRLHGELLLDPSFAVNKMKSELLHAGEESSSGSVKLVQAMKERKVAEWVRPGGVQSLLVEELAQWLRGREDLDDCFRFVPSSEGGDVEVVKQFEGEGYVTKVVRIGGKVLKAPRSVHGQAAASSKLRLWLSKDASKKFDVRTNAIWADVYGFLFFARPGLDHQVRLAPRGRGGSLKMRPPLIPTAPPPL